MSEMEKQLIGQLDKWIEDCQAQADVFFEKGMTISEASSLAMKVAYMNVKTFLQEGIIYPNPSESNPR